MVIINRTFTRRNGYSRGYISYSDLGFRDNIMVYLLPPLASGKIRVNSIDLICPLT